MIVYIDSSVIVRAHLPDEPGHHDAVSVLGDPTYAKVTGTWTRIEVSGALVHAARRGRANEQDVLRMLDSELATSVDVVAAEQDHVERQALTLVRRHGLRAMDAWHLAVAGIAVPPLLAAGEERGFATRDDEQGRVAERLGFVRV